MDKKEIQVFGNAEFGEIRTIEINGDPWFVGNDVTQILGYEKSRNALAKHVDEDDALKWGVTDSLGRTQKTTVINESGLYSLIISSKLPSAKAFKRWVTSDVLPTIRKHGGYINRELLDRLIESEEERKVFLETLKQERMKCNILREEIEDIKENNEVLEDCVRLIAPKAEYCDIILKCENSIPISIIAKDYGMTAIAFNKLLNTVGIQYKIRGTWLLQKKYNNCGFTESMTYQVRGKDGKMKAVVHTCWTQLGRKMIYDILKSFSVFPNCERF